MNLTLRAYRLLTWLMEPVAPLLLSLRARRGKEDPARLSERLGQASVTRPAGPLVWMHAASVGEGLSLLPVIARVRERRPDAAILVTTGTVTSARLMAQRLPPGVIHQYTPLDGPRAVSRFLGHWQPEVGLFVESELWPNLILSAHAGGTRLVLASARITARSAEGWTKRPAAARALLSCFQLVLPQDRVSADRLTALGSRVDGLVNLKMVGDPLPFDRRAFDRLSQSIGDRPVVVLASTHEGEEHALVRALAGLSSKPCLVVIPRHPDRAAAIQAELATLGPVNMRSRGQMPDATTPLYLADTLNEMGLFLRLADVVILGGAFGPVIGRPEVGGHNPLEPARLGRFTLTGPDMANWQDISRHMQAHGGLEIVDDLDHLAVRVETLLADPDAARRLGRQAEAAAQATDGGLERLWQGLEALLPPPMKGPR